MVDWRENPERWVERRAEYLSSTDVALRETVAEAVAWSELGYSSTGIAKKMDVGDSTAKKYLDRASQKYAGILLQTVTDLDNPETPLDGLPETDTRECPVCEKERLTTPQDADRVYNVSGWGATDMLEDATLVCPHCHSVRINGVWKRMESVDSRAYELSQTGSKSQSEYKEILTRGVTTGRSRGAGGGRAAPNHEQLEW